MKNKVIGRLDAMRQLMKQAGIDAAIFPQADPHSSEYLASHWQVRRFLTGFTGSAGDLVLTASSALLWTDSRYFIQAADQLEGTGIVLMKDGLPDTPSIIDYLTSTLPSGATVGIDGMLFTIEATRELKKALDAAGLRLEVNFRPIDGIWTDRPALPDTPLIIHDDIYAGQPAAEKIELVLARAESAKANSILISALDEIAWTLNLRGRDIPYNPVVYAFLFLSRSFGNILFVNPDKITPEVKAHLDSINVSVSPYNNIERFLTDLPATAKVHLSGSQTAGILATILGDKVVEAGSAVADFKACKNETQVNGIRDAMRRDGAALVGAMMEIEKRAAEGGLTEVEVDDILLKHRSAQPLFFDKSFATAAGWGPNGAIVHYEAENDTCATIDGDNLLLIDSGAQYLDGTTDITRTIAIGTPTPRQCRDFTLVMKGHIALATAVWPRGTNGLQLDILARQFLWKDGLTYLHGTGHGVGHFLNVHEGPQKISLIYKPAPLVPGMITSNEPGLYREGKWGIRCENLTLVVPAMSDKEFGDFYRFETLTLFPFDLALFDLDIMTDDEIDWLNAYHRQVADELAPLLPDEESRRWLADRTRPINRK